MNFTQRFKHLKGIQQISDKRQKKIQLNKSLKVFQQHSNKKQYVNMSKYINNQNNEQLNQFLSGCQKLIENFKTTKYQLKQLFHEQSKEFPKNNELYKQKNSEIEANIIGIKMGSQRFDFPLKKQRITQNIELPQFKRFKIRQNILHKINSQSYLTNNFNERFDGVRSIRAPFIKRQQSVSSREKIIKNTKQQKYKQGSLERSEIKTIFNLNEIQNKANNRIHLNPQLIETEGEKSKSLYIPSSQPFNAFNAQKPQLPATKIQKMKSYTTYIEKDKYHYPPKHNGNQYEAQTSSHCKTQILIHQQRLKTCNQKEKINSLQKEIRSVVVYTKNPQYFSVKKEQSLSTTKKIAVLLKQLINLYTKAEISKYQFPLCLGGQ